MKQENEENISDIEDSVSNHPKLKLSQIKRLSLIDIFDDASISSPAHSARSAVHIPHNYSRSLSPTDSLMSPTSLRVQQLHHKKLTRTESEFSQEQHDQQQIKDFSLQTNLSRCSFPLMDGIPLILGSSSSSRQEVFTMLKWPFTVMSPDIDEKAIRTSNYTELPQLIAKAKAKALMECLKEDKVQGPLVLLTADQIVLYKDTMREKPENNEQAKHYLQSYSNDSVSTCSAIVATHYPSGRQACDIDIATVYWKEILNDVIDAVIERGNVNNIYL